jgi:hypothetical protein
MLIANASSAGRKSSRDCLARTTVDGRVDPLDVVASRSCVIYKMTKDPEATHDFARTILPLFRPVSDMSDGVREMVPLKHSLLLQRYCQTRRKYQIPRATFGTPLR